MGAPPTRWFHLADIERRPVDELRCALLAWAGAFSSLVLGVPLSKCAHILDLTTGSLIPIGSVSELCRCIVGGPLLSWATAPVLAGMKSGHIPTTLFQWPRLDTPCLDFPPPTDAPHSLLVPSTFCLSDVVAINVDGDSSPFAARHCFDFAIAMANVTCMHPRYPGCVLVCGAGSLCQLWR